jgi:gluconate 2-dehydrogenase gamma chain
MNNPKPEARASLSRRRFFKSLGIVPLAAGLPGCMPGDGTHGKTADANAGEYAPTFFNPMQYTALTAICDRLIPSDEVGPGAVESGVPAFIDRHMQTPYANGAIWYTQGPFLEAALEFGYQGKLTLREILSVGLDALDAHCKRAFDGRAFAGLEHAQQEDLLRQAEGGELELDSISARTFFSYLLGEVRNGYFSDPKYGGNKDMGAWKMIGYPGARADYRDWVTVRDKPYPLPPVDQAGKRA